MTPRERVQASIDRRPLDALPWQFDLTSAAAGRLKAYYGADDLMAATGDHIRFVSHTPGPAEAGRRPVDQEPADASSGFLRDEFGVVWRRQPRDRNYGDWGELVSHPLDPANLRVP